MNRRVTYKTLWLVSARDESARRQQFSQKTLLLGPNGTGKSRVVKNLYWVFGCKTRKRDAGTWDPDTVAAYNELKGDFAYLTDRAGEAIECPTCGTVHENSFHARILLSSDAESLGGLIMELRTQADEIGSREANIRSSLRAVERSIAELDKLQQERRAKLKLEEVLASQSKKTLDTAFQRVSGDLSTALKRLEAEKAKADEEVKKFEDPDRLAQVRKYFSSQVSSLSNLVDVPIDEQIGDPKPGSRAQSGGSSAPRSMLAVHLAMLATNAEWGDSTQMAPSVRRST
ncbi:MAG: hypothetical protein KGI91_16050 [Burkholderiales bacterium]|nr:hypothetical protein [Burkholderiales bacterium]